MILIILEYSFKLSLIDLTKKIENKDEVINQLSNFKNAIFIPTMPSNSNKVATNVKDLKPAGDIGF